MPVLLVASTSIVGACIALPLLKGRFVSKKKHSGCLAMASFGPITSIRSVVWTARKVFIPIGKALDKGKSEEAHLAEYCARESDIIIAVPEKSGTTWLMQIAHQLRMKGVEKAYEDQMDIIPWLEGGAARLLNQDMNMEQFAEPRLFKSHLTWTKLEESPVPDNAKIVYCFRSIEDQLYSFWKFLPPFTECEIPCWAFTTCLCIVGFVDTGLNNLCDFWEHRHDKRVCFFFFDDLLQNHLGCVQRMQRFMDLEPDEAVVQKVLKQSTHEYMSKADQHSKFDDHKIVFSIDKERGITRTVPLTGKVRKTGGKTGDGKETLPPSVKKWIEWRWKCIVLPRTGFADLRAMRAAWAQELS
eukprot:TRINITY_DN49226_c0_g1_i1.p1 TRINITY_DN49226_c0_g1~~TRINITY_DN49226_c0_g1_i1.p1  ORF type:complete len:390 (+),score=61.71 TRINITY_DN49226_c0_g1_i1:104-1171(+)